MPIDVGEVVKAVTNVKNNKAGSYDKIVNEQIKAYLPLMKKNPL